MSETPKSRTREELVSGTVRQLRTLISIFGDDRGYYVTELGKFEPSAEFVIKTVWGTLDEFQRAEEPIGQIALQGLPHSRVLLTMRAGRTYRKGRETFAVLREICGRPYSYKEDGPPPTNEQIERFNHFCDSLVRYLTQLGAISDEGGQRTAVRPRTGVKPHKVQQSILQVVANIQKQSPNQPVADTQIAERLGLDVRDVQMHLDLMEEERYVNLAKSLRGYGALVTSRGRMMLQEPDYFQREASAQVIHVIDSHIQNLAQTGANAVVNQSASSGLDDNILKIIDQMVEMVHSSDDIEPVIKQDYELEAKGLKTELRKSRLNLSRIREMFAFLGDIEDNLGLATRLAPYLVALGPHIERLIGQI